jgi:ubiquinone biosynthesis protein COQ4
MATTQSTRRGRVQWRRAWRAVRRLVADPEQTEQAFEVIAAFEGPSPDRLFARFARHPEGRRLLAERPSLLASLSDRDALAAMPEGSFGRAYLEFMRSAGLSADGLVAASEAPGQARERDNPDVRWLGDRMRDVHDLWHVLTGYGRDEAGEAANLAFSFAQTRNRGIGLLTLAAAFEGARTDGFAWPRYMYQAWRRGRAATWLPVARYEELLPRPLDLVRIALGIRPAVEAHPDGIVVANRDDDPAGAVAAAHG